MKTAIKTGIAGVLGSRSAINGPAPVRAAAAFSLASLDDRRRVPTAHGHVTIRTGNLVERWRADTLLTKEPQTIRWLERTMRNDSVFFDIGGNIGLYTVYALTLPGRESARALCFEPEALNFARLNLNINDNGLSARALAFCIGLGGSNGIGSLRVSNLLAGSALHGDRYVAADASNIRTGMVRTTLDRLCAEIPDIDPPTHLKIDVDGPELDILRGGLETLRHRALRHVLVEFEETEMAEGTKILGDAGFKLVDTGAKTQGIANAIYEKQ